MTYEQLEAFDRVRHALGRARLKLVIMGVFVAGLGSLFHLGTDADSTMGAKLLIWGLTGFFAVVSVVLIGVGLYKNSPDRSPLVRALRDRPEDVVWLYRQDVKVTMSGIETPVRDCNVFVKLADGSTTAITVHKAKEGELMKALQVLAPRAATGFSQEREAQFKRDARSLIDAGPALSTNAPRNAVS